jgi:hypothetical protein
LHRMVRSARIDGAMFRSLREDNRATRQSILALALAGLSLGLGYETWIGDNLYRILLGGVFGIALSFLVGFLWVSLTYLVVTRVFKCASTFWSLGRPIFFASSPAFLFLLMLIPRSPISGLVLDVGVAWIAVSNVFAIKNAMGFDNQRSFITFIISAFILLILYDVAVSLLPSA